MTKCYAQILPSLKSEFSVELYEKGSRSEGEEMGSPHCRGNLPLMNSKSPVGQCFPLGLGIVFHPFLCCMKDMEMWQEINPPVSQPVLGNQRGWVWLHLISDCSQFGTVSLLEFSENLHEHRFTNSAFYQSSAVGLAEFSETLQKSY